MIHILHSARFWEGKTWVKVDGARVLARKMLVNLQQLKCLTFSYFVVNLEYGWVKYCE